jgi:hypothetical protein
MILRKSTPKTLRNRVPTTEHQLIQLPPRIKQKINNSRESTPQKPKTGQIHHNQNRTIEQSTTATNQPAKTPQKNSETAFNCRHKPKLSACVASDHVAFQPLEQLGL